MCKNIGAAHLNRDAFCNGQDRYGGGGAYCFRSDLYIFLVLAKEIILILPSCTHKLVKHLIVKGEKYIEKRRCRTLPQENILYRNML